MSKFKGFVGSSYVLRNSRYDCQRTVNLFPVVDETSLGKGAEIAQLERTPGLTLLPVTVLGIDGSSTTLNVSAGANVAFLTGQGECYWCFQDGLYQLTSTSTGWVLQKRATFYPGPNVTMCDNLHEQDLILPAGFGSGSSVFIVSNGQGWTYDVVTKQLASLPSLSQTRPTGGTDSDYSTITTAVGDPIKPTSCTFMDGYVIFSLQNSNTFYWTNLYDTAIDALSYATAEVNSDAVVGVLNNNEDLWIFGQRTVEIWYNAGASATSGVGSSTVFARKQGLLLEQGCISPTSVCKVIDNRIAWLATSERGGPIAVLTDGYAANRISTFAIEQLWSALTPDQLAATACTAFTQEGHTFVVFNIPGLSSTWVYDLTSSTQLQAPQWHERMHADTRTGQFGRWLAAGHVYFQNTHIVSDRRHGTLLVLDPNGYTDAGDPIIRQRVTPHLSNEGKRLVYSALQIDARTGVGDTSTLQPTLTLEYSNDGGNTWSAGIERSLGPIGGYMSRVVFRQLGQSRDRVFRLTFSDPTDFAISGANLDVSPASA